MECLKELKFLQHRVGLLDSLPESLRPPALLLPHWSLYVA
jgi:hypothetical protein